ncbi:PAS domain S-box protein [soil metagenome]
MTEPPASAHGAPSAAAAPVRPWRWRRAVLWSALVGLLVVAQSALVWLTINYESARALEQADAAATGAVGDVHQALARDQQSLQALLWNDPPPAHWRTEAVALLHSRRELLRIERRDASQRIVDAVDSPFQPPLFAMIARPEMDVETELACVASQRLSAPAYSRSYFVPARDGLGAEVMDWCVPVMRGGQPDGFMTATFSLARLLDEIVSPELLRAHELSFVEGDGTRLARAGLRRGARVFVAERLVDLPGITLQLRADSVAGSPQFIPNLAVALVLGLSFALAVVVGLLVRDVRRRAGAEAALAEALAFRKAMEDSLVTGLRARDPSGRITYVNPAFCEMVGFEAAELVGQTTPPYWPPEKVGEYAARQGVRLSTPAFIGEPPGADAPVRESMVRESRLRESREGFETVFIRRTGERFAVLIFEAPLVDGNGRHTGWMSAVLDVSAQRRVEEISRQQQERLQATARLATVGEMASLLSHELNQPLAAIASYAAGSLNLLGEAIDAGESGTQAIEPDTLPMLLHATQRIAEQAERAGRVIKSVHDFVRRREQAREAMRVDVLLDAVLPLVRLQARKSGARVEVDLPESPDALPRVVCDRTMVEQVLLNLTRNGIQAMENHRADAERVLSIRVRAVDARWVRFSVLDRGPGIAADVSQRLFTPFFTTRSEGMGLGLSLCRTVVEQHGGALDFENLLLPADGTVSGTEFRFTLPAESADRARRAARLVDAPSEPTPTRTGGAAAGLAALSEPESDIEALPTSTDTTHP